MTAVSSPVRNHHTSASASNGAGAGPGTGSGSNHKPTSKVIDSLHSQIDSLKEQLESTQTSCDDFRKKYNVAIQKNESYVDQLANSKHETDMINALLKRKERRIMELENQINELYSTNDSLTLTTKNLKIRCDNLQESSVSSIAEYERLKISYDSLITSQLEYKRHYQQELNQLHEQFNSYKQSQSKNLESLQQKFANNDKDVDILLDSLTNKRIAMDSIYVKKNKMVLNLLFNLSKVAKLHGQDSKQILQQSVETINTLIEKYPDLQDKISKAEEIEVDLDGILSESQQTLDNCSFDDDLSVSSEDKDISSSRNVSSSSTSSNPSSSSLQRSNTLQNKKRKNKRNSIRFDSKGPDFSHIVTPTTNNQSQFSLPKRPSTNPANQPNNTPNNRNISNNSSTPSSRQSSMSYHTSYDANTFQITQPNRHNSANNHNQNNNSNSNSNNNSKGSYRNNSGNGNNNSNNGGGMSKQAKRRSMYGGNNNNNNGGGNGNHHNKRNSQLFDTTNLNYPLNSN